jgi:hypothetical protein
VERQRSIYLESELDAAERNRFAVALSRQVPAKQKELEELSLSTDPRKHTAFYFGLQTFGSDFLGLEPYVRERLSSLSDVQREIMVFMSLAHHYAQRTIPQQAFAPRLGVPPSQPIKLDRILPSEALDLIVKVDEDRGGWRPAHELVALEILIQLLIPGGGDRRNWRQRLSAWAEQFAVFCRADDPVAGYELFEVIRRTFVYRDNRDDLGTERSSSARFAKLIDDIPSHEGQHGRTQQALQTWDNLLSRPGVYRPPVRRSIVWTYLADCKRSWENLKGKDVDRIVYLLGQNMKEEPDNEKDLRLWVRAVRIASNTPSIESVIERVVYWRANTTALDATYYLYVLKAIQAIEGSNLALDEALRYREECSRKAQFRRNRTISFEWLGCQTGIKALVHHSSLGQWLKEEDFWERVEPLARVSGRIAEMKTPQSGSIQLECGLKAFFVPAKGNHSRGHSENLLVTFHLGFSYDGLRAWAVKDLS